MRIVCRKKFRRRYWGCSPGMVAEGEFRLPGGGRLLAKVLVFERATDLRRFHDRILHREKLGPGCIGFVTDLGRYREVDGRVVAYEVDPRYFCIICLLRRHCTMRVLSHEAVHAAFCYAKRRHRSDWDSLAAMRDEESIAYPAGEVGRKLVEFLEKVGVYDT